ncbi:unnamed protein product [Didymodactylos carnosus]|uniref:Uncharacterized protein n=1 Tax=Didymodactylos carnosus TaxID=1234261 RepID=A0A816C1Z9_9BILA|nr:unnamed protein product [Didymodactylos carnosus]CAF4503381.1 unnamed protein product [Didymodactylos carnosus]
MWKSNGGKKIADIDKKEVFETHYFVSENHENKQQPIEEKFQKRAYVLKKKREETRRRSRSMSSHASCGALYCCVVKKLRTPKSVIHTIDERVRVEEPSRVYRQLVSSTEGVTTVNNSRQVENRRARHLAQFKLSQDEIYSTYKIALDNKSFVKQFILTPNLIIICGHDKGMEMFKQLLKIIKTKIMLSYDTTFQLTDAYVRYTVIWN